MPNEEYISGDYYVNGKKTSPRVITKTVYDTENFESPMRLNDLLKIQGITFGSLETNANKVEIKVSENYPKCNFICLVATNDIILDNKWYYQDKPIAISNNNNLYNITANDIVFIMITSDQKSLFVLNVYHESNSLYTGSAYHNNIYRGKNLGNNVTPQQYAVISNGTFDGLFIGDYWEINNIKWRIAAFDYYYNTGYKSGAPNSGACLTHHVVIVPDTILYNARMNDTDTTEGAYLNSKMKTEYLNQAITTIESAFGAEHILEYNAIFENATTNGVPSAGMWTSTKVDLMTQCNVYGVRIFTFGSEDRTPPVPYNYTIDKTQFPLFRLDVSKINIRQSYWLRDCAGSPQFAYCYCYGYANCFRASNSLGVRPAFAIKS